MFASHFLLAFLAGSRPVYAPCSANIAERSASRPLLPDPNALLDNWPLTLRAADRSVCEPAMLFHGLIVLILIPATALSMALHSNDFGLQEFLFGVPKRTGEVGYRM